MAEFDVEAFVAHLHGMGLKLSAIPLADGSFRISRWRMVNAADDERIQEFWASQIGDNQQRIDALAAHLAKKMTPIVSSTPYRPESKPSAAVSASAPPVDPSAETAPPATAEQHSPTVAQTSANIQARTTFAKIAGIQPSTGVPRIPPSGQSKSFKVERPGTPGLAPEAPKPSGLQTGAGVPRSPGATAAMPRPLGTRPAATVSRPPGAAAGAAPDASAAATQPDSHTSPGTVPVPAECASVPERPAAADGPPPHAPAPSGGSNEPAS